jgi:O-antigen ligase
MDPTSSDNYRILDNQYLGWILQTGFLGLAAYLALLAAALTLAHRVAVHSEDPDARRIGVASVAAFTAFVVANAIFDLTSFVQVPYLFCMIAGFCSVAALERSAPARAGAAKPATA